MRGLVHISQLASMKVEKVEDVVSVDDVVWVKILSVEEQPPQPPHTRPRYKISLSMKDASQDGHATDLGAETERHQELSHQITSNLNSSIGMGVALDPMAAATAAARSRNSNLILKQQNKPATIINGYALVDDDEGEPTQPQGEPQTSAAATVTSVTITTTTPADFKPMGRGRGTTLPAWMTRQQQNGPTGTLSSDKNLTKDHDNDENDDESRSTTKSDRKRHKKRKRRKHHHKSRSSSNNNKHRKSSHHRKKRSHRSSKDRHVSRSRSRSLSRSSSSSTSTRGRSNENGERKDSDANKKGRNRNHHEDNSNHQPTFQSVEDAQRLIERLEAKKTKYERKS